MAEQVRLTEPERVVLRTSGSWPNVGVDLFMEVERIIAARLQAARAEDAARLAEARAEERADILSKLERLAGNLDYSGDVNRILRALRNVLPPLGVTAPTASEAGDATAHLPCDMGCQPDWHRDDCAIYIKVPAPAEVSEVEGSGS